MASDKDKLFEKIYYLAERLSIFLYWLREPHGRGKARSASACARPEGSNATRTTVRMFQFENHAFYVHEKHYVDGYRYLDIQTTDSSKTYYITWEDLLSVLETPVVKKIELDKEANKHYKKRR